MTERKNIPNNVKNAVFRKYLNRCSYCGVELDIFNGEIDHVAPISRGGENTFYNLAPACRYCNRRKGTKSHQEFWEFLSKTFDKDWMMRAACNYPMFELDGEKYILHFYWEYAFNQDLCDFTNSPTEWGAE